MGLLNLLGIPDNPFASALGSVNPAQTQTVQSPVAATVAKVAQAIHPNQPAQAPAPQVQTGPGAYDQTAQTKSFPGTVPASYIYAGLRKRGLNDAQTFATMGEWKQESEFRPRALNPGEGAVGFNQWRQGRAAALGRYAAATGRSADNPDTQMDFFMRETGFTPDETGTVPVDPGGAGFVHAKTIGEANAALHQYTRYGSPPDKGGQITRLNNAYTFAKMLGGPGGPLVPGETLHLGSRRGGGGQGRQPPEAGPSGAGMDVTVPAGYGLQTAGGANASDPLAGIDFSKETGDTGLAVGDQQGGRGGGGGGTLAPEQFPGGYEGRPQHDYSVQQYMVNKSLRTFHDLSPTATIDAVAAIGSKLRGGLREGGGGSA